MSSPAPLSSEASTPGPVLTAGGEAPAALQEVDGDSVTWRITWRLVPFLCLLYAVNYLDRTNIAMAKFQMLRDLPLDDRSYGVAAGIFYVGYFLFEVPSNLLLQRVGARRWIARIMLSWGLISTLMMFVKGAAGLNLLRVLLGFAEAGFFPGIVLYLTYWVPPRQRAHTMAAFMTSIALSGVIGNPLAGALLKLDGRVMPGLGPLHGWQWVYLIEGLPPILLALAVLRWLPDGPWSARWLTPAERRWVTDGVEKGQAEGRAAGVAPDDDHGLAGLGRALRDGRLWLMCGIYFMLIMGLYGFIYWVPTIVKGIIGSDGPAEAAAAAVQAAAAVSQTAAGASPVVTVASHAAAVAAQSGGASDLKVGLLSAIPNAAAAVGMVLIGRSSDRTGERRWHVAGCALLAAVSLSLLSLGMPAWVDMVALCLAAVGIFGALAPFWTIPTRFLRGTAAAGGIAIINSLGNLAGLLSGPLIGWITTRQHGRAAGGMLVVSASLVLGAVMVVCVPRAAEGRRL